MAKWKAEEARDEALRARNALAATLSQLEIAKLDAERKKELADSLAKEATTQRDEATTARDIATYEKDRAERLKTIADVESQSYLSLQLLNQGKTKEAAQLALDSKAKLPDTLIAANYSALVQTLAEIEGANFSSSDHNASIRAITSHPSQNLLISGDESGTIHAFKPSEAELQNSPIDYKFIQNNRTPVVTRVRSIAINNESNLVACGGADGLVEIFDLSSDKLIHTDTTGVKNGVRSCAFLSVNKKDHLLILRDKDLRLISVADKKTVATITIKAQTSVIDVKNNSVLYSDGKDVYQVSVTSSAPITISSPTQFTHATKSLRITALAHGINPGEFIIGYSNGEIELASATGVKPLNMGHSAPITGIDACKTKDGNMLIACSSYDGKISLLTLTPSRSNFKDVASTIVAHDGKWVYDLSFNSDGSYLVSVGEDRKVKQWIVNAEDIANRIDKWLSANE